MIRVLAFALALSACSQLGGARPRITPLHGSAVVMVRIRADSATRALAAALAARQVPLRTVSGAEGYVESAWYDVERGAAANPAAGRLDQVVKVRFYSDPVGFETRVIGEVVRRIMQDPSLPERDLERVVPDDHAGRLLLDSVMTRALPPSVRQDTTARRSSGPSSRTS